MRPPVLLAFALVVLTAATAQAVTYHETEGSGPECETHSQGETCAATSREERGVAVGDARVGVYETERESSGHHDGDSPNSWSTTREGTGVVASDGTRTVEVGIANHTYHATQTDDGRTRTTDEQGYSVEAHASFLPGDYPRASVSEREVDGGYRQCGVGLGGGTLVTVPCDASGLPLPVDGAATLP